MTTIALDPNPKNQLGKGVLPTLLEESLLADGYVFACMVPPTTPRSPSTLVRCKRFIVDAVTDGDLDNPRRVSMASTSSADLTPTLALV